jgi:hypothetical protein
MVKLQRVKDRFFVTVPKEKIKRKGWVGGEEFDVEWDQNGNLVFVELK